MGPRRGHSSSLLPILGVVGLSGVVALVACKDGNGGLPPIQNVADVIEVQEDIDQYQCQCYAAAHGESVEECLAELGLTDAEEACLSEIFDGDPEAFAVLRCQTEAIRGLFECEKAEGCPAPFSCADGSTVPGDYVCDGFSDCADGSDEQQDCPPSAMCADGETIPNSYVCDGFPDCPDESDEDGCPDPFMCGDGEQVPSGWVCDGEPDCEDGSDEEQACPQTCELRWYQQYETCGEYGQEVEDRVELCFGFRCFDGTALDPGQECDGVEDCATGEDEYCSSDGTTDGTSGG